MVLAIDPGRQKCGIAVVQRDGTPLKREIVPVERLLPTVLELTAKYAPVAIVCGDGTGAKPILKLLRENIKAAVQEADQETDKNDSLEPASPVLTILTIVTIDESYSSEQARARFLRENRPPLLQRLLPPSLRTPWRPYDDYVAQILAERYWQSREETPTEAVSN